MAKFRHFKIMMKTFDVPPDLTKTKKMMIKKGLTMKPIYANCFFHVRQHTMYNSNEIK